jgi:fumarate reductase (CoM/CoB) subunit B
MEMKEFTVRVFRFDPEYDEKPHFQTYSVMVSEGARVLHVLHAIHDEHDPTLSYRYCCASGQCGSCAVKVNGEPVLACMEEARDGMTVEPLDLPIIKDLVIDIEPYIASLHPLVPAPEFRMPTPGEVEELKPLRSCIECLACVSACPALKVIDFAGPTAMRQELRLQLDPRDQQDRVTEAVGEGLFTCTSCQACWKVCPKDIQIPGKAIEKLRALANKKGLTLPRHQDVAKLVKDTGRSVVRTDTTFLEQVPEVLEPYGEVKGTVGFFVGCMYNLRLPQTALDAMEVLRRNGIRVIIPKEQVCCGSPLIRTGQVDFLDTLKRRNIDAFAFRNIDTVLTMCAGCGSTLKHDYTKTPFKVMDINEVLIKYGIEPPARLPLRATYHDPCHLLRGQGIKIHPRELITQVVDLIEMPAICCGSGGGVKSGVPDEAAALGEKRREEISRTGADIVISSCPFCEYHLREHTDRPVKNVATLLLEGYREKDRRAKEQKPC